MHRHFLAIGYVDGIKSLAIACLDLVNGFSHAAGKRLAQHGLTRIARQDGGDAAITVGLGGILVLCQRFTGRSNGGKYGEVSQISRGITFARIGNTGDAIVVR